MSSKSKDKSKQEYEFPYKRAPQKAIDEMVPACIAMFSYYMSTPTSFPMFYDTMVRAFPKACSEADRRMHNDNTARLYDKTMQEVKQLGYKADPETDNPIKDGMDARQAKLDAAKAEKTSLWEDARKAYYTQLSVLNSEDTVENKQKADDLFFAMQLAGEHMVNATKRANNSAIQGIIFNA